MVGVAGDKPGDLPRSLAVLNRPGWSSCPRCSWWSRTSSTWHGAGTAIGPTRRTTWRANGA